MKVKTITGCAASLLLISSALAQVSSVPASKLLPPQECANVSKAPDGTYIIHGAIHVGGATIGNDRVPPNGIKLGGLNVFDLITQSCFSGKH